MHFLTKYQNFIYLLMFYLFIYLFTYLFNQEGPIEIQYLFYQHW